MDTILSFLMRTMQLAKNVTVIKLLGKFQAVAGKATSDKKKPYGLIYILQHPRFTEKKIRNPIGKLSTKFPSTQISNTLESLMEGLTGQRR